MIMQPQGSGNPNVPASLRACVLMAWEKRTPNVPSGGAGGGPIRDPVFTDGPREMDCRPEDVLDERRQPLAARPHRLPGAFCDLVVVQTPLGCQIGPHIPTSLVPNGAKFGEHRTNDVCVRLGNEISLGAFARSQCGRILPGTTQS